MSLEGPFLPIMGAFSLYRVILFDIFRGGGEWHLGTWFNVRGLIPHPTGLGISLIVKIGDIFLELTV